MTEFSKYLLMGIVLTTLAGCGYNTNDRVLSGAGLGAGVGAVGSAVTGGNPLVGAAVGGVAGGAIGGLTRSKDLNLGKPLWR